MAEGNKNQSLIIPIGIILLGVIAGYFFYANFVTPSVSPAMINTSVAGNFNKFKNFNRFDFSVFDNSIFKSLKVFGESPVTPGQTGKIDLFAP